MNDIRRKRLGAIAEKLEELKIELEDIYEEEDQAIENMPENLCGTDRYDKMEEARDDLELAIDEIESTMYYINEVIDA